MSPNNLFSITFEVERRIQIQIIREAEIVQLSPSGSLTDVRQVSFTIDCIQGRSYQAPNPLKTDFDLANFYELQSETELTPSPFFRSWTTEVDQRFSNTDGVWLSSNTENLTLLIGKGDRNLIRDFFEARTSSELDGTLFFVLPQNLINAEAVPVRIITICMN